MRRVNKKSGLTLYGVVSSNLFHHFLCCYLSVCRGLPKPCNSGNEFSSFKNSTLKSPTFRETKTLTSMGQFTTHPPVIWHSWLENGPFFQIYLLLKMGIFQPANVSLPEGIHPSGFIRTRYCRFPMKLRWVICCLSSRHWRNLLAQVVLRPGSLKMGRHEWRDMGPLYEFVTGVITPVNGVITLLITSSGQLLPETVTEALRNQPSPKGNESFLKTFEKFRGQKTLLF